jgi:hypothetical protein
LKSILKKVFFFADCVRMSDSEETLKKTILKLLKKKNFFGFKLLGGGGTIDRHRQARASGVTSGFARLLHVGRIAASLCSVCYDTTIKIGCAERRLCL